jgi:YidC/Oxa1 family membrane protein insertase
MNILYQVFILPIETIMQLVLSSVYAATGSYGLSIFVLSLLINVALLPLFQLAERWQEAERNVQKLLKPKLKQFRQAFSGAERHAMIDTLYRQAGYHPIYAMRSSVGLLLQLPFWIAAYQLLSRYEPLHGASFLIFKDLGQPDRLLWGLNLLPFVMTALNVAAAFVYTRGFSPAEQIQPLLLASLFLVLLYSAPSGLLLYWTFNSLFSLLRIMVYAPSYVNRTRSVAQAEKSITEKNQRPNVWAGLGRWRLHFLKGGPLSRTVIQSPYVFALLAGLWPIVFYVSNNWYMVEASRIPLIVSTFAAIIGIFLTAWYMALSWLCKRYSHGDAAQVALRSLVFVSIIVMAYLLRRTLLPMVGGNEPLFLIGVFLVASTVGWFTPRLRIARLNLVLGAMILVHVLLGLHAVVASKSSGMVLFDQMDSAERQAGFDKVQFARTPNVYYIVPDAYPNAEGLKAIFGLEVAGFYEELKGLGFTIYPSVFSNYMSTIASISSVLGMDHHYYRGSIGNFEFLNARKFIVSQQNPVVRIFRNNGYQIHYVHETDYLFSNGCFIDSCSPLGVWGEFREILFARTLIASSLFSGVPHSANAGQFTESFDELKQARSEFIERVQEHIESMARQKAPHFTYIHGGRPGHSVPGEQTAEQLADFRKEFVERIRLANAEVMLFVRHILSRDPSALIILNGDHGPWAYGNFNYNEAEILRSVPNDLMTLDHLGVLLAIRWPNGLAQDARGIRTNVNIFPHVLSYLSGIKGILAAEAADDGYIAQHGGGEKRLCMVIQNGEILEHLIKLDSARKPIFGTE